MTRFAVSYKRKCRFTSPCAPSSSNGEVHRHRRPWRSLARGSGVRAAGACQTGETGGVVPAIRYPDPADQLANAELASALVLAHGSKSHLPNNPLVFDADAKDRSRRLEPLIERFSRDGKLAALNSFALMLDNNPRAAYKRPASRARAAV